MDLQEAKRVLVNAMTYASTAERDSLTDMAEEVSQAVEAIVEEATQRAVFAVARQQQHAGGQLQP